MCLFQIVTQNLFHQDFCDFLLLLLLLNWDIQESYFLFEKQTNNKQKKPDIRRIKDGHCMSAENNGFSEIAVNPAEVNESWLLKKAAVS